MDSLSGRSAHPFGLLLTSDARAEGLVSPLHSAARRGDLVKVRPGAYLPRAHWTALTTIERYLVRVHAVGLTFRSPLFAHQSAGALHGLPLLDSRLQRLHLRSTTPRGSGSRGDVTVHVGHGNPDIVERQGLRMTSVARTVWDLARVLPHGEGLAVADAAIRPRSLHEGSDGVGSGLCTKAELLAMASQQIAVRGGWNAYLAIAEADALAGSVGESMARSLFIRLGAPRPTLQASLWDDIGLIGYGDFFWPEYDVVGEFDGKLKYGTDNPSGERPEVVVYREKLREDRIRRRTSGFFRFGWADVMNPPRVAAMLRNVGIPLSRSAAWAELRDQALDGDNALVGSVAPPRTDG